MLACLLPLGLVDWVIADARLNDFRGAAIVLVANLGRPAERRKTCLGGVYDVEKGGGQFDDVMSLVRASDPVAAFLAKIALGFAHQRGVPWVFGQVFIAGFGDQDLIL